MLLHGQHCRTESPAIESRRIDAVWTERNLPARSQPPDECRALCFPNRPSQILPLRTKEPHNVLHFLHFYTVLENPTAVFRLNVVLSVLSVVVIRISSGRTPCAPRARRRALDLPAWL